MKRLDQKRFEKVTKKVLGTWQRICTLWQESIAGSKEPERLLEVSVTCIFK